jgi:hypothetical protein
MRATTARVVLPTPLFMLGASLLLDGLDHCSIECLDIVDGLIAGRSLLFCQSLLGQFTPGAYGSGSRLYG